MVVRIKYRRECRKAGNVESVSVQLSYKSSPKASVLPDGKFAISNNEQQVLVSDFDSLPSS